MIDVSAHHFKSGVDARCNLSRDASLPSSYTVDVKREQANVCVCVCVRILTRVVLKR